MIESKQTAKTKAHYDIELCGSTRRNWHSTKCKRHADRRDSFYLLPEAINWEHCNIISDRAIGRIVDRYNLIRSVSESIQVK